MESEQFALQMESFNRIANEVASQIVAYISASRNNVGNQSLFTASDSTQTTSRNQSEAQTNPVIGLNINTGNIHAEELANTTRNLNDLLSILGRRQVIMSSQAIRHRNQGGNLNVVGDNDINQNPNIINAPPINNMQEVQEPLINGLGAQANAENVHHDIIDWVYYSIRALVLLVALYVNSSMFKLLLILSMITIVVLYRRSVRRNEQRRQEQEIARRHARQQQLENEQRANNTDVQSQTTTQMEGSRVSANNGDGNQPTQELRQRRPVDGESGGEVVGSEVVNQGQSNADGVDSGNADSQQQLQEQQAGPVTFFKMLYMIVTSFITSLVPE